MTSRFRFGFLALTWLVTSSDNLAEPKPARPEHTNRLAHEKCPYLLQHAHNPVDWYPWGEEAFAKARSENKPIFLSSGYSTCHWCHVMANESRRLGRRITTKLSNKAARSLRHSVNLNQRQLRKGKSTRRF